jgi:hypothetical protein
VIPHVVEAQPDGTAASVAAADAGLVGPLLASPVMLVAAPGGVVTGRGNVGPTDPHETHRMTHGITKLGGDPIPLPQGVADDLADLDRICLLVGERSPLTDHLELRVLTKNVARPTPLGDLLNHLSLSPSRRVAEWAAKLSAGDRD